MPWKESSIMSERLEFIRLAMQELCRAFSARISVGRLVQGLRAKALTPGYYIARRWRARRITYASRVKRQVRSTTSLSKSK